MDHQSFLFQAFVFLGAAVIMLPLAKRLGLGSILGYLLAGVIIGPFVLGFIGSEGQDIMHAAEFGVVMMLFLIGLELDPELLWKLRRAILGLGGLQVTITTLVVAAICMLLHMTWREALVIGMIMSLSSTAIVLQTLNEKDLLKTTGGQSSFSVLLFQDIAVIPMLALFPLLTIHAPGTLHTDDHVTSTWVTEQHGGVQALIVFLSIAFIITSGRFFIRPLLRIIAQTHLREAFTATALFLVVSIAVLMTYIGLSAALGTFLAGVVLANSEFKHELESDIEPFKGLLLGLFFIAVGASIDFNLIWSSPLLILSIVMGLMLIKGIILWVLGKLFNLTSNQRWLFAAALCQVGEFAFVLLSLTQQQALLDTATVQLLMAAVAISMALTPFVMLIYEKLPVKNTRSVTDEREPDAIEDKNKVIIAGFGHFGNTIGRFLRANGVHATYLDIDSDRVELLRKMSFNVHYGDASRHDLLAAAGAASARIIILGIDNAAKRMEMIETIKKHFPHLEIFARSSNRYDAYDQLQAGIKNIYRESVDTSIRLGCDVLKRLGKRSYAAERAGRFFLKYDEEVLLKLAAFYREKDSPEYLSEANKYITELESILKDEAKDLKSDIDSGWDTQSLREEFGRAR